MAHGDITHVEIPVKDIARARAFYSEIFGWDISDVPGFENYPMWRAPNQISGGALVLQEEGFTQPRSVIEVDSIEAALATAERLGGSVVMAKTAIDETSSWALFIDPDGNSIGVYEGPADEAS